jgi:hypothetical protein
MQGERRHHTTHMRLRKEDPFSSVVSRLGAFRCLPVQTKILGCRLETARGSQDERRRK